MGNGSGAVDIATGGRVGKSAPVAEGVSVDVAEAADAVGQVGYVL